MKDRQLLRHIFSKLLLASLPFSTFVSAQSLNPNLGLPTSPPTFDLTRFVLTGNNVGPVSLPILRTTSIGSEDDAYLVADGFNTKTLNASGRSDLVMRGGSVSSFARSSDDSHMVLYNGSVRDAYAQGRSRLVIDGGTITRNLSGSSEAVTELRSGTINGYASFGADSVLHMSGGDIRGSVFFDGTSSALLTGGAINNALFGFSQSRLEVMGDYEADLLMYRSSSAFLGGSVEDISLFGDATIDIDGGTFHSLRTSDNSRVEINSAVVDNGEGSFRISGRSRVYIDSLKYLRYSGYYDESDYVYTEIDDYPSGVISQSGYLAFDSGTLSYLRISDSATFELLDGHVERMEIEDEANADLQRGTITNLLVTGGNTDLAGTAFDRVTQQGGVVTLRRSQANGQVDLEAGRLDIRFYGNSAGDAYIRDYANFPLTEPSHCTVFCGGSGNVNFGGRIPPEIRSQYNEFIPVSALPEEGLTITFTTYGIDSTLTLRKTPGATGYVYFYGY